MKLLYGVVVLCAAIYFICFFIVAFRHIQEYEVVIRLLLLSAWLGGFCFGRGLTLIEKDKK